MADIGATAGREIVVGKGSNGVWVGADGRVIRMEQGGGVLVVDYPVEDWAAAQSYAAVGLLAAAYCHEGLGNWEEAKHYFKANADRYPQGGSVRWCMFCRRTGKGEVGAMRARAKEYLDDPATRRDKEQPAIVAAFYRLEGDLEEAFSLYEKTFDKDGNPYYGVHAALVADQLGQTERRDALLQRVVKEGPEYINDETGHPGRKPQGTTRQHLQQGR